MAACSLCGSHMKENWADDAEDADGDELPPYSDLTTSLDAAVSMQGHTAELRAQVLAAIVASGDTGRTCDELEVQLGLSHQTCSARVNELWRMQRIDGVGKRLTRSRRKAWVWFPATDATLALAVGVVRNLYVTNCRDCPLCAETVFCQHPKAPPCGFEDWEKAQEEERPPINCPLRESPLTLRLK